MNNKNIALIINDDCKFPSDYKEYNVDELDSIADGSCDNLYIGDLLDYIEQDKQLDLLKKLLTKIKVEIGCLHIKAPDILQTCWYASKMNLDINKLRYILYQTNRKNCYTIDEIASIVNLIENAIIGSASYVNLYEYSITVNKYEN